MDPCFTYKKAFPNHYAQWVSPGMRKGMLKEKELSDRGQSGEGQELRTGRWKKKQVL